MFARKKKGGFQGRTGKAQFVVCVTRKTPGVTELKKEMEAG